MKCSYALAIVATLVLIGTAFDAAQAKRPKGFGLFKNFGQWRSFHQKQINMVHPTGQARAAAEHRVNFVGKIRR